MHEHGLCMYQSFIQTFTIQTKEVFWNEFFSWPFRCLQKWFWSCTIGWFSLHSPVIYDIDESIYLWWNKAVAYIVLCKQFVLMYGKINTKLLFRIVPSVWICHCARLSHSKTSHFHQWLSPPPTYALAHTNTQELLHFYSLASSKLSSSLTSSTLFMSCTFFFFSSLFLIVLKIMHEEKIQAIILYHYLWLFFL